MRGGGEPLISQARRQVDYRGEHSCVFPSQYREGWESNPDKRSLELGDENHTIGIEQDHRFNITPSGLKANDVLCSRVPTNYDI